MYSNLRKHGFTERFEQESLFAGARLADNSFVAGIESDSLGGRAV
jgi:hypothetical protein